jgi:hypothetical protein
MRKSRKNRAIKNKTIKKRSKCVYTDETRRLMKVIKELKKIKSKTNYKIPQVYTKTMKKK